MVVVKNICCVGAGYVGKFWKKKRNNYYSFTQQKL